MCACRPRCCVESCGHPCEACALPPCLWGSGAQSLRPAWQVPFPTEPWTLVHRPVGGHTIAKECAGLSACHLLALCLFCDRTWAVWSRHSHLFSLMSGEATLNHIFLLSYTLFSFFSINGLRLLRIQAMKLRKHWRIPSIKTELEGAGSRWGAKGLSKEMTPLRLFTRECWPFLVECFYSVILYSW